MIEDLLADAREAAEELMTATCAVVRLVPGEDEDGLDIEVEVPVYEGRCKVQTFEPYETVIISAGNPRVQQRYTLHVPVGSGPFKIGDLARFPDRRTLRVAGLLDKTHQTAVRLLCDEETNRD